MFWKIVIVLIVLAGGWYAYNNYKYETITVCVDKEEELIPITCEIQQDCVMYLTSAYTVGYPRSDLFSSLLTQVSSCKEGHCYLKSFDFAENMVNKRCESGQTSLIFKVTPKDMVAITGGIL